MTHTDQHLMTHTDQQLMTHTDQQLTRRTKQSRHTRYYRRADKSLSQPTLRYILFDGENTSFDSSLVIYTYK
jgi:hypothetical protein